MFPCSACQRHILDSESVCPFCGVEQRVVSADSGVCVGAFLIATTMALGLSACGRQVTNLDDGGTTTTTSSGTTDPNTQDTEDTTSDPTTDTGTTMGTTDDSSSNSSNPGVSFYAGPDTDWGGVSGCDPWQQDCPEGEKCVAYASTGGTWDANKCVQVTGDGQPGETCLYGGPVEATDDCGSESYCWDVTDVDGQPLGVCRAFCGGTAEDPICAPGASCLIANDDTINLCIENCDPVAQDCGPELGCYFYLDAFNCIWTTQDIPVGEPCEYLNDCVEGTGCMPADVMPDCVGSSCCASFCSLSQPACPQMGTECAPFFADGMAPMEYVDVGICIAPVGP